MPKQRHVITLDEVLNAIRDHTITVASSSGMGWKARMDFNFTTRTFQVYDHGELVTETISAFVATRAYNEQTTMRS